MYLAGDGGGEEAQEVSEEGAVEVGEPVPVGRKGDPLLGQLGRLRLLVRVVPRSDHRYIDIYYR